MRFLRELSVPVLAGGMVGFGMGFLSLKRFALQSLSADLFRAWYPFLWGARLDPLFHLAVTAALAWLAVWALVRMDLVRDSFREGSPAERRGLLGRWLVWSLLAGALTAIGLSMVNPLEWVSIPARSVLAGTV
ncbi:MAG: hypothetical protein AB1758_27210, partial [Candidatus Eremiobacterota bacterium]